MNVSLVILIMNEVEEAVFAYDFLSKIRNSTSLQFALELIIFQAPWPREKFEIFFVCNREWACTS